MKSLPPLYHRLFGYIRRYFFPHLVLLAVVMLVLSATNGAIPFIVRRFINQLSHFKDVDAIKLIALEILGIIVLRSIAGFGRSYLNAYIGQRIVLDIRSDLNRRLQHMPLSFFNRTATGVMMSRVINDVRMISTGITNGAFSVFGDGVSLVAVMGAAFWIDWKLALIAFVVFPSAVGPVMHFSRQMRKLAKRAQKQLGGITVVLQETYQGTRVVKAFGMEEYERQRFDGELRRLFRISMRAVRIRAATGPMIEAMAALAIVIIMWYGAASVVSGTRTLGTFGAFIAAALIVYEPFKRLASTNNTIQQSLGGAERVFEMMDEPLGVEEARDGIALKPGRHSIRFDQVSFRYGRQWVLHDVSLEIPAGRVIALVGMSGGGKSTIADLIPRFYDVQKGSITVDDIDVRKLSLDSLRSEIGVVTQHTFLFNDTVRANIAYGSMEKTEAEIVAAARAANAHDFISRLPKGYDTVVGEMAVRISGGERQRIAIARALLKDAPILILDEATSSLDSEAERVVQEALERLMHNRTTLVIAHRLSTVRRADRIAVLVRGRIVEQGTHDELFAMGQEYRKLYDLQFATSGELAGDGQRHPVS
jgi:ATP-binding cassette, subfamily B, bacterial MsbA